MNIVICSKCNKKRDKSEFPFCQCELKGFILVDEQSGKIVDSTPGACEMMDQIFKMTGEKQKQAER